MRQCEAVDKAWVGRRELWLSCRLSAGHNGAHHDPRHKGHYWTETFYEREFEWGRPRKIPTVKKVRLCKKCGKQQRTDGANDACICKETGADKRQAIMFADEREKIERAASERNLQKDIDWLMGEWKREEEENGYHAAW